MSAVAYTQRLLVKAQSGPSKNVRVTRGKVAGRRNPKEDAMPTQQLELNGGVSSGPDMTTDSRTPQPDRLPEPPLRVFISYKKKDHAASQADRRPPASVW